MIKLLKKKLLESLIKDLAEELPNIENKIWLILEEKKDYVFAQIKEAIKDKLTELVESYFNKKD